MGKTATYNYDLAGRLNDKTLPNGIKVTYQYDAADRVTSIAYTKTDNTPIEGVAYAYDAGGQRIAKGIGGSGAQEKTPNSNARLHATSLATPFPCCCRDTAKLFCCSLLFSSPVDHSSPNRPVGHWHPTSN